MDIKGNKKMTFNSVTIETSEQLRELLQKAIDFGFERGVNEVSN